jgi:hypothetical protein
MEPSQGNAVGRSRRENLLAVLIALCSLALVVGVVAAVGASSEPEQRVTAAEDGDSSATEPSGEAELAVESTDAHADGDAHTHDEGATSATDAHSDDGHSHALTANSSASNGTTSTTHGNHPHDTTPTAAGGTSPPTHSDDGHAHPPVTTPGGTTPNTSTTPTTHNHNPTVPPAQLADLPADIQSQIKYITGWARQFPTAADATAGGYPQLTKYFPGIAAHYINVGLLFDRKPFDWTKPEVLLYDAEGPNAQLVGINYIVYSGATPPEGFPGPWDEWHAHPSLCLRGGVVIGEQPPAECRQIGGSPLDFTGYWLLHMWSIPGWEAPEGIFAHANSRV